jgi:hypothetical protein
MKGLTIEEQNISDDEYVERQKQLNKERGIDFIHFKEKKYRSIKGGEYRICLEDNELDYLNDDEDYELE